jgi:hypothetical protein
MSSGGRISGGPLISGSGGQRSRRQQSQPVQQQYVVAAQPEQYVPTETTNNLFSTSYIKILDLIGEGEIEGLVNGLQSIYLDGTPIQNPDGSLNFRGVTVEIRNGTQFQDYIPGFDEVASETGVGVVVTAPAPVTRTITEPVDAARVSVTLPALQEFTDKGDVLGASVNLQISVQYNGGGYSVVVDDTISGRTSQQYQRQYRINLSGPFPVDIRVSRVTPDSTSSKVNNAFSWGSFSEITYAKLSYPNTAVIGYRIEADQFNGAIPSRSCRLRGLKVQIPSNATVDNATGRSIYSSVWNGTFGAAQWTSDPAWCLWTLLTSRRFGFGDHLDASKLDRWAFYSASQYASALVPDGFGGWEPRFSCKANIQTADDAYRLIGDLCSVMRCMPYWAAGALTISQDRPADPSFSFTLANVGPEGFNYSGSSLKARPTVAVVRYQDLDLRSESFEVVEDAAGIARYGVVKTEIEAFACTSRGQARRLGEWLLYSEANEGEVVAFTSNLAAGAVVRPGQIIQIADPLRAGSRRGGAIAAATTSAIALDDATGLAVANSPTLSVILPDATVETRPVVSITGNVVAVSPAFSSAPQANSIWVFESSNILASLWRVLAVGENDGVRYPITALAHNPSKYGHIENDLALTKRDITDLDIIPNPPQNLTGVEVLYEVGGRVAAKLQVSWSSVPGVGTYRVSYRRSPGNWEQGHVGAPSIEILDIQAGTYEILVASVKAGIIFSRPAQLRFATVGKTAPPVNVAGASLLPIDGASGILSWDRAPDLDVRVGGRVLIRHSPRLDTPAWGEATSIVQAAGGNEVQKMVPLLEGTYLLKFQDDGGRESLDVAYVTTDLPEPQKRLLVKTYAEDAESPPFNGNAINMFYSEHFGALILGSVFPWDSAEGLFDSRAGMIDDPSTALTEPVAAQGEYEFGSTYSMTGVFDVNIRRRLQTRATSQIDMFDSRTGLFDDAAGDFDGDFISAVDAALLVRSTQDDPTGSPQWSEWREVANGIVRGRGFQFKLVATSGDSSQNILVEELGAEMELQQRIEQSGTLSAPASTHAVTFAEQFYAAPNIGVTGYSMMAGDYWVVDPASITRAGFSLTFRNSTGAAVARQFNYNAIGFGREVA